VVDFGACGAGRWAPQSGAVRTCEERKADPFPSVQSLGPRVSWGGFCHPLVDVAVGPGRAGAEAWFGWDKAALSLFLSNTENRAHSPFFILELGFFLLSLLHHLSRNFKERLRTLCGCE
jgi:hypothetical protein